MNLLSKINVFSIIRKHFNTLINDNTGKPDFSDLFVFVILPLLGAVPLLFFKIKLNNDAITIIITTLSILVGLFFNVIVIIFDILKRDSSKKNKNKLLHQLLTNISFSILLSILIIVLTLATFISQPCINIISTGIVYFLLGNFLVTVLMILKRMFVLFDNELIELGGKKN